MTTLAELKEMVVKHTKENPDHGVGCTCMDNLVRLLRRELFVIFPWDYKELLENKQGRKSQEQINLILRQAVR